MPKIKYYAPFEVKLTAKQIRDLENKCREKFGFPADAEISDTDILIQAEMERMIDELPDGWRTFP